MNNNNNFDLLRFVFAFVVFLVHAQTLSQNSTIVPLAEWLSSEIAIEGFFVISGYLVYMSHQNSRSTVHYLKKRVRRIYPAYLAVILLCSILGAAVSTFSISDYLTSSELAKYLVANLLFLNFLEPNLPGVFEGNPLTAINGALWTLKVEVMFYVSVPLIAWIAKRHGHALTLTSIYAASIAYAAVMKHFHVTTGHEFYEILARQLPGQLTYFVIGMALYHWRDKAPQMRAALFPSLLILWFIHDPILRLVAVPAALGLIVICVATVIPAMGNFGRFGDLSYGVYILHFPILQTLIAFQLFPRTGWQGICIAIALVIPAAFLSWHLIEKRWLQKSSHYLTTAHGS